MENVRVCQSQIRWPQRHQRVNVKRILMELIVRSIWMCARVKSVQIMGIVGLKAIMKSYANAMRIIVESNAKKQI
jgi:hypothetical protein